jgi:hypothetical protein
MILNLKNTDGRLKASNIKYRLYFALLSEIDVDNFPKAVSATISSNVLLPGKKHHVLDAKINTVNPTGAAGESQGNIALTLSPQIEGFSKEALDFIYKLNGERIIVFWEDCKSNKYFIAGSPCSGGLLVSVSSLGKMEDGFYGAVLEMVGGECPEPFYFYEGPIVLDSPALIPANAATFALTDNYQYQLSDNTAATALTDITGVTDSEVGRIIELIGGGVNFPTTIAPTAEFILKNGVAWTGTQGSKITFQIVKTGSSTYAFYEIHRS